MDAVYRVPARVQKTLMNGAVGGVRVVSLTDCNRCGVLIMKVGCRAEEFGDL